MTIKQRLIVFVYLETNNKSFKKIVLLAKAESDISCFFHPMDKNLFRSIQLAGELIYYSGVVDFFLKKYMKYYFSSKRYDLSFPRSLYKAPPPSLNWEKMQYSFIAILFSFSIHHRQSEKSTRIACLNTEEKICLHGSS